MQSISTIEYHVGGHPVRVVTAGMPGAQGADAVARAAWFETHADDLRRAVVGEPRGHDDLLAVALTEATHPDAHAGLLFFDRVGYPALPLVSVVAAATACVEHGLVTTRGEGAAALAFETAAGLVRTRPRLAASTPVSPSTAQRVVEVATAVDGAFVHTASAAVVWGGRRVALDIAYGGGFYAIVDSEAAGVPLDRAHAADLRRAGLGLCREVAARFSLRHPDAEGPWPVEGVILTGPPSSDHAHLRSAVVSRSGVVDRSALSAVAPVLAVLSGMGVLESGQAFVQEGLAGVGVAATVARREPASDNGVSERLDLTVTASAWPTGEQTWLLHADDPLRHGSPGS